MATIAEIREKYPQYSDMPDAALADALHSKFYSDMPKTDFYAKIGLGTTQTAPTGYGSEVPQVTPDGQLIRQPDAIPGARPSFQDVLGGIVETPLAVSTGMVAGAVAPIAGVIRSVTGGKYGTQEGVRQGQELAGRVQRALTYQPQTRGGQAAVETIGELAEPLQAIPFSQGSNVAALTPAALRQAANIARTEAGYLKGAINEIPSVKAAAEARVAESYARAPQIDAAKLAPKYGISLDPAASNPTLRNKARTGLVGAADVDMRLSESNKPKWTAAVKKDLGIADDVSLTDKKVFDQVRARDDIAGPYNQAREIKNVIVDQDILNKLDDLQIAPTYNDMGQAAQANAYIANIKKNLLAGGDGKKLLDTVSSLRREADVIFDARSRGTVVDPVALDIAEVKRSAAKVLEQLIDDNIPNVQARDAYVKARTKMAQTYDVQSATNFGTGQVDPNVFAKLVAKGEPVSGVVGDLGKIAAVYPEIASLSGVDKNLIPRLTRAGPGGALGGIIGLAAGGGVGAPVGIALGAGASELLRRVAANRMTSPSFQTSRAIPQDYRPQPTVNALRPVTPGSSNIVPFNAANALVEPEIRPNFVFGRPEVDVRPVPPSAGPRQLEAPSAEGTLKRVADEEVRRTRMAQMAESEALAAEGRTPRAPTTGEMLFDLDPVTGQLRPASQGIRGATPETFQDYTSTLRSATTKLSSGQKFALDAAEKVAFEKTRVDLAEVVPGFKALNDKAIAERMMDRNWVQDALQKAREKEAAFAEIESRARSPEMMGARAESAKNAEALRQATEARDRVMSSIEVLEEQLRQLRPDTSRKSQGPKTRAAKRNALASDIENRNALTK